MNKKSKIGIFDSGLGGISVLNTIQKLMPNETYIYIGDSKNAPYGSKSKDEVFELSKKICDEFITSDVKAIVIACNTATSAAVSRLRGLYNVTIIGMEPAIKPALKQTKGTVLVLATEMTLKEEKFNILVDSLNDGYRIIKQPAPEWVDCVENHLSDKVYIEHEVANLLDKIDVQIDGIVLGCTHFIFLKDAIMKYYRNKPEIFDGNMGTALQLRSLLESNMLLNDETHDESNDLSVELRNTKSEDFVIKSYELLDLLRKSE